MKATPDFIRGSPPRMRGIASPLSSEQNAGDSSDVEQPLPIPNRVVKRVSGENSVLVTKCEDSSSPALCSVE